MKTIGRTATKKEKQGAKRFFSAKAPKPITSSMSRDEALIQQMINYFHRGNSPHTGFPYMAAP